MARVSPVIAVKDPVTPGVMSPVVTYARANVAAVPPPPPPAATAAVTYAVLAACVVFVPGAAVGTAGVPVNVGDTRSDFSAMAAACAVLTGFAVSAVLLTLPSPTIAADTPDTVPVNVGDASGAFRARDAVTVDVSAFADNTADTAVDTGLLMSAVLSTRDNWTSDLDRTTTPVRPFTLSTAPPPPPPP